MTALLATQESRILRFLLQHPTEPQSAFDIAAHLYQGRSDGGPNYPVNVIKVTICRVRAKLAPHGVNLLTIGSGYMVDPDHTERLRYVMAADKSAAIERARRKYLVRHGRIGRESAPNVVGVLLTAG